MKAKIFFIVIILSFLSNLNAQSYNDLWKDVNENLENQLPQSADNILDKIEQKAINDDNQKELLKTFLYRFKIFASQDENPIESSIYFAEENISKLQEPEQSIFNIAIASLYENYLNDYYHIIKNNIPIYNSQQTLSMKFWDEATFKRVISRHYEAALTDVKALQDNTTESYSEILGLNDNIKANIESGIEPTLYDYVVHKVISQRDKEATRQQAVDLYKELISFDKKNNYDNAAIYNEIYKLKYEYETDDDYEAYLDSLEKIKEENIDNILVTSVMALQAEAVLSQQTTDNGQQSSSESALEICDEAIKLFPNSVGAKQCESIRSEILRKELTLSMQNVVLPNQDIRAKITYRNLMNPHYRIYEFAQEELEDFKNKSKKDIVKYLLKKNYIIENEIEIPVETRQYSSKDKYNHEAVITNNLEVSLPKLGHGTYFIMFSKDDKFSKSDDELPAIHLFQVSRLSFVTTRENDDFMIYVLDRDSGKPVKDVNVNIYKDTYDYKQRKYVNTTIVNLITDNKGIAVLPKTTSNSFHINLYTENDKLLSDAYFSDYRDEDVALREKTTFFTDRAIYRPGQTVYYKGVIMNQNSKTKELLVGKETEVIIRDANWQELATQTHITDEFGSFNGSFVIPDNLSNGYFNISNESGSLSFKVEDYKRPTFEVAFNKPDKAFKLNEEIKLSGAVKAYAGFGLDNVSYDYTVMRRAYFPYRLWWYRNYDDNEKQIAFGEGTTDKEGNFDIDFKLVSDDDDKDKLPVYEYIVTVNATSVQGETQSKTFTLKVSDIDLIIDVDKQQEIVFRDSLDKITFSVKNLKENPVEAEIIRKIYKANSQQLTANSQLIYEDVIVVDGRYGLFQNVNKNLDDGRYVIELVSADNELAMTSIELTIVDLRDNKMPYDTMCISYYDKETAQPGEDVNFYLGSSAKDVRVYVMIKHGDEVRHAEHKTISDKVMKVAYKIKEEDRGMISFQAFFVKHNTINIVQHNVSIPYDNLKLDIRLDVERDNLLPGAEETWRLTVGGFGEGESKGEIIANILACMYDASLDVFAKNRWSFNTMPDIIVSEMPKSDGSFSDFSCSADIRHFRHYIVFDYYLLSDIPLIPSFRYYKSVITSRDLMLMPERDRNAIAVQVGGVGAVENEEYEAISIYKRSSHTAEMYEMSTYDSSEDVESQEMMIRDDFNETAFFYPDMITNEDGSLTFSFKMPDAITRWNLMMLAYTKDLKVGTLNKTFTTSKPLMIMSDMPRFCYENDTMWVVANVIRTTDNSQQSTDFENVSAKLEIFDALTMQALNLILSEQEINIDDVPEGGSKSVRWKVVADTDIDANLLAFRFSVTSDDFSDAEQRLLPILSDEVFMTETYPLTVDANSEKDLDYNFNNDNERNQGLTLNFCANPVWYAIQALPYLSQETGEHADAVFNIFYANSLASYIAHGIPNLLTYIERWKIETPDILMSQLQKDESLKAIILQETPWVLEAKNETEQKSRIANLFDIKTLSDQIDETLSLINEKQSVNGGWSWLPGMPESPFITQYILSGFGRLYKMNVIDSLAAAQQNMAEVISKQAIAYICQDLVEYYDKYKDYKKFYTSDVLTISELYALSFFDFEENAKYKIVRNFFMKRLEEEWRDFNFATQAQTALVLNRAGNKEVAELIMKSLSERMPRLQTTTDVSVQTLVMEAFEEITPDQHIINMMMTGLLNNKRTNMWENAKSSVDAIYAIVKTTRLQDDETTRLSVESGKQSISIIVDGGQQPIVNSQQPIFIQRYWDADEMKDIDNLMIENNSDNMVWGGLFRQYFVSVDKLRKHATTLNIERKLYIERIDEKGVCLVPLAETEMNVGDKIVVILTFEASQDMEFVFLKDLRAACMEPTEQMSRYKYSDGMYYYQSNSDTFMGFYLDNVTKGKHQLTYSMYVTKEGDFSNGYALIQCVYAPEFSAYSEGMRVKVGM